MFKIKNKSYCRVDLVLINNRGLNLECSHYMPVDRPAKLPCVVYLHCNSGSRFEATFLVESVLKRGFTLFCFDFAGSGLSEGDYVSLGWFERDDVRDVIDHLTYQDQSSSIVLWGRSMGAATALLHAARDSRVTALVADSSFSSLASLIDHIAAQYPIPGFLADLMMSSVKDTILEKAGFDFTHISPVQAAQFCKMPGFFTSALQDEIVPCTHSIEVFNAYAGPKHYLPLSGEHNSARPNFLYSQVFEYLEDIDEY
jgi:pimeloyl-ACP methyl ester carboxylesterase